MSLRWWRGAGSGREGLVPVDRCCMSSADSVDPGEVYIPEWDQLVAPDEMADCGGSGGCGMQA
ncbi:hypothetical protein J2T58_001541 [Methanocalculus alkaliphilus]|uniref:hypothetical protein n=1 Tax=Methanocalculus alkaliphilus TaxID=768730 RepID=UPI00209E47BC|nr:hypothetical protein [Methanocalculus alkaliphilus]MCP1715674.1 hypothetical protein [Methanocalculus alkaliphilus]